MSTLEPQSIWLDAKRRQYDPIVESGKHFDVAIIGGGITGLTAAYLLRQAGKSVAVVERRRIGEVETGHTTAHLTYVTDERLGDLAQNFDESAARLLWAGGASAISTIERIISTENFACAFRRVPGYLHGALFEDRDEAQSLRDDATLARQLGFDAEFLPQVPYFPKPGVRFSQQALFHPVKYLNGLASKVHGDGCAVYEQSEVTQVEDDPLAIIANGQKLTADYLIVATHVPLMGNASFVRATLFQTKLYPYTSYALAATAPAGTVPEASYWDTSDPYFYLRVERRDDRDMLIFGGCDHKTGQCDDEREPWQKLEARLREIVPAAKITHRWSGQVIETNDGLPYIGEIAPRQFCATGFAGNGMTFGTLAATMACDAVLGRENPWADLLHVERKKLRGGLWDYLTENFDYPYYFLRDRLTPRSDREPGDLNPGEGAILKIDGQKVACHRDDKGKLHQVSAVCTHMGCLVRWNEGEQTWDCPCHGSRFSTSGAVLAGPAEAPLEQMAQNI